MQPSSVRIGSMNRNTEQKCPSCREGFIIDQRANAVTKDTPYWICSNSLTNCNYSKKYGKKWQWSSWEWEVPYFIQMSENTTQKNQRLAYEKDILLSQEQIAKRNEIDKEIIQEIKYCRVCGLRNCQKINNCL